MDGATAARPACWIDEAATRREFSARSASGQRIASWLREQLRVIKLRLKRMGAKKRPSYRIVVADSRSPRDGRFIESIGYYDPIAEPKTLKIDEERAKHWLSVGAQPTDTVKSLFQKQGIGADAA